MLNGGPGGAVDRPRRRRVVTPWGSVAHRGRENADAVLIAALAAGKTAVEAAALAGVSRQTVARRTADPDFAARLAAAKGEALGEALEFLRLLLGRSVGTLGALLASDDQRVRLRAAKVLLDQFTRMNQQHEIEARLRELEEHARGSGRSR